MKYLSSYLIKKSPEIHIGHWLADDKSLQRAMHIFLREENSFSGQTYL